MVVVGLSTSYHQNAIGRSAISQPYDLPRKCAVEDGSLDGQFSLLRIHLGIGSDHWAVLLALKYGLDAAPELLVGWAAIISTCLLKLRKTTYQSENINTVFAFYQGWINAVGETAYFFFGIKAVR